jgi:ATP-dependent Clp protease ATP-binding subunit ClpA
VYKNFTDRARKVMQLANREARHFNHEYIGTEHILLGLVLEGAGVAANVLKNLDIDTSKIRREVEKVVQHGTGGEQVVTGRLPHTPWAKKVLDFSVEESRNLNHNYVGTEHILLGLLREGQGVAAQVLTNVGLKLEEVREEVLNLLGHNLPNENSSKLNQPSSLPSDPRTQELDEEINRLNLEKENAIADQDFNKAAELRDRVIELKRHRAKIILAVAYKIPKELQPATTEIYPVSDLTSADLNAPPQQPTGDGGISLDIQFLSAENPLSSPQTEEPYPRFTDRSRKAMQLANQEAQRLNHEYIGTEHILLGLVKEGMGVAANVLKNLDIDLPKIRLEVEKIVQHGPDGEQVVMGRLPHTPRAKKVIAYSVEEARNLNHNYVGTEHLLLGLLREHEGVAAQVLLNLGVKLEDLREGIINLLGRTTAPVVMNRKEKLEHIHKEYLKLSKPAREQAGTDSSQSITVDASSHSPALPDAAPAAFESLTVHQIALIHERIRFLNEQKETCVATQDFVQASQFRAEAEALKRLFDLYSWFQSQF